MEHWNSPIIEPGWHLHPTPRGAFRAFSCVAGSPSRQVIRDLLSRPISGPVALNAEAGPSVSLKVLADALEKCWLRGFRSPRRCPEGPFERTAPELLARLSAEGMALLADGHGFLLAASGFSHTDAEALSALSADLAGLHERRPHSMPGLGDWQASAWATVDDSGKSLLGFWPIHIDEFRFVLVVGGRPRLHNAAYVNLIWILNLRYASRSGRPGDGACQIQG